MIEVIKTNIFDAWFERLRDSRAKARILARISRVEDGNLGDAKFFDGIGELRIDYGPGYRIYFLKRGDVVVILLCGGDKGSQSRDIKRALDIAKEV